MIDNIIIFILVMICIVAVGIVVIQPLFPLFHRMELDRICNNYVDRMLINSSAENIGLTISDISDLKTELVSRGFTVSSVNVSANANYGNDINLSAEVTREYKQLQGDLTYVTKTVTMHYSNSTKGLGI
ncbi:MAG: hypothetical protein JXR88_03600 [Clostridia bacterium]|nr:hypothetical protein [Clostridia bacterium]